MKNWVIIFVFGSILSLFSCAKCNICEIDSVEKDICTNSLLDRAKAKTDCKKQGGAWSIPERQ